MNGLHEPAFTWRALWVDAEARLGSSLEARRILERASGYDGASLIVHLDRPVPARAVPFVEGMVERRAAGEPLQYVLGRWGFRRLVLLVDRRVLIPRPETEVVVDVALAELARVGAEGDPVVVDLGTGSGAIALAVASESEASQVWATDVSADALAVARANLAGLGSRHAFRVRLAHGRWFDALPEALRGNVQLIVSNPPYIAESEALPSEVADWEPAAALIAGPTGMEAVADIVGEARQWLARPSALVVELAPNQAEGASELARAAGFASVDVRPDLQGRLRVLVARA